MKILYLSFFFAPLNSMASLRAIKQTKYLFKSGIITYVLTSDFRLMHNCSNLKPEIPDKYIYRAKYYDIFKNSLINQISHKIKERYQASSSASLCHKRNELPLFRVERIKHFWSNFIPISFVRMPDRTFTWIPSAYRIARYILNTKDVDIIFTSSPPPSASILGSFLQRKTGLPWVAEFRDLWSLNSLEKRILIIDLAERLIERQVLKNAAALVTVSEKLRHHLELLHKKPTYVVYNGFDPEDFADNIPLLKEFTITYTGSLSSKRNPSPLFHALSILRKSGYISKDFFRLRFIGTRYEEYITNLAKYYKIEDMVEVYGRVNYKRSIRAQKESTLLLLLEGMDPESKGVLTGKIFEYIASGRPVLAICHERGEIAQLLQKCRIGAVVNQPSQIATFLIKCLNRFRQGDFYFGFHVNQQEIDRYSRKNQSDTLANIFQKLTNGDI